MMLHIARSRPHTLLLLRNYRIDVRLDVSPEEHQVIRAHNLHKIEIFYDPHRDDLIAQAEAARARYQALPWFSGTHGHDTLTTVRESWRENAANIRALLAFRLTVGNLISGVSITNRRLSEISKVEHVLQACVDDIKATVDAALHYQDGYEDIHAPDDDDGKPRHTNPSEWPSSW